MREKYSNYITKFNSPFACYLHELALEGLFDDEQGDVFTTIFWFGKNHQHALVCDDLGFVNHVRAYAPVPKENN